MWFKKIIIFFFISLSTYEIAISQEPPVKEDSTQLYKDIETYSKRKGFTKFMYRLVFKPSVPATKKPAKKKAIEN
jgi:hypothetical protein